jgi:hypothetical protein
MWQFTITDSLRLAPFLAGPRASSLLLWWTTNSWAHSELPWTKSVPRKHTNSLPTSSGLLTRVSFPVITVRRPWQQTPLQRVPFCSLKSRCVGNHCNYRRCHICSRVFVYSAIPRTWVANRYLAATMFTQPLAGNGRLLPLRYSGF